MNRLFSFGHLSGAAAAAALGITIATPASAGAFGSAEADAILEIVSDLTGLTIDGSTVDGSTDPFLFDESEIGIASAQADGASDFFDVGIDQLALVSAETIQSKPFSEASAFFGSDGMLTIGNVSGADLVVDFELTWSVFAEAVVDGYVDEAFGEAIVDLSGDAEFFATAFADSELGIPSDFSTDVFAFSLTIPDGQSAELFLLVDALAGAVSVPVAGTLPLWTGGLLGLGVFGLRRRG